MSEEQGNAPEQESAEKPPVAVAEKPAAAPAPAVEEKPVNTDTFNNCTRRCTRRAWDIFLEVRDDIEAFKSRLVRGRLTFATPQAAQDAHKMLVEEGGVAEITTNENVIELTASLAAVQLVIKLPNTQMFDAMKLE